MKNKFISRTWAIIISIITFGSVVIKYLEYFSVSPVEGKKTITMLITKFDSHAFLEALGWGVFVLYLLITIHWVIYKRIKEGKAELDKSVTDKYNELHAVEIAKIDNLQRIVDNIGIVKQKSEFPLLIANTMLMREVIIPKLFTRDELKDAIKKYSFFDLEGLKAFGFDDELIQTIKTENQRRQVEEESRNLKSQEDKLDEFKNN
jgi:hypothetical protein